MELRDTLSLETVLIGIEATLYIEHTERDVRKTISNARAQLERNLGISLSKSIDQLMSETTTGRESISLFMQSIAEQLKSLALITGLTIFDKQFDINLKDYNYLGFSKEECLTALTYLQDKALYATRESFFENFINSVNSIINCEVKRLIIILGIFESLDLVEGVSLVAQYLYLCTKGRA